jgi:amino acid adenylation domain-containing protein
VELYWQTFGADGLFNVIFNPQWEIAPPVAGDSLIQIWRYANAPAQHLTSANLDRELQDRLREDLPAYMVPAAIIVLSAWPLTPNGKIDHKALPVPERLNRIYRVPKNPQEQILCDIFAEVLSLERVSVTDSFFDLGGHSLLATRLASRVRLTLGLELPLRVLFESPSVAELAPRLLLAERARTPLARRERPQHLPLSYAQQRLWFIDQLEGASAEYNMPEALRLRGQLDIHALECTVNAIVERHESLRTHFAVVDGDPTQIIEPSLQLVLPVEDLTALDKEQQQRAVDAALRREWEEAFDLGRGPVFRVRLLKLGHNDHVLLRAFHHIVSDGWSLSIFNREFMLLYDAFRAGRQNPLPPLPIQYADFTLWQRDWLNEDTLRTDLDYWKMQLAGIPEQLALPRDRPRPEKQTFAAGMVRATLTSAQVRALKQCARENHATLYMTLLSAFSVLLSRYSGETDIVIGSAIANRQDALLEQLIGFFVNSLVMRVRVNVRNAFAELLAHVRKMALEAYLHQDLPFERLVEEISPQRSLNVTPLYQVSFDLQNTPLDQQQLSGLDVEPMKSSELMVRFDLEVHAFERHDHIDLYWIFNHDLFDRWRMEQMARHYVRLVDALADAPKTLLAEVSLLDAQERRFVLESLNATECLLPHEQVVSLFERQVQQNPQALAVACGTERISYLQLNQHANSLAHWLVRAGAAPEKVVAVAVERSPELVVTLLAVLKSGAAYLPLPFDYPSARLVQIISDVAPVMVIAGPGMKARLREFSSVPVLDVTALDGISIDLPHHNLGTLAMPGHAAYVLYTSGTTGGPKGVMVTHAALANKVHTLKNYLGLDENARYAVISSTGFDPLLEQILCPLCAGAACVIVPDAVREDVQGFARCVQEQGITVVDATPRLLETLLPQGRLPVRLQTLILGGEVLPPALAARLHAAGAAERILNFYGPTEACIDATAHEITAADATALRVPIGVPLGNYRVYVLDEFMEPVPLGVGGELYIGGAGVARGYLKRVELTAERFVPDPFSGEAGGRLYRSGDVCAWRVDGQLEFWGRNDQQVKVRGMRLELGEIEAALKRHARVEDALVVLREEAGGGEPRLCGYVIARPEEGERMEAQARQIEYWRQVHESAWLGEAEAGDFNIVGWNSSYTGEAIAAEEMRVWVEETVKRIRKLQPRRVLEIGCGTGLLLTRLAPDCESYVGVDFSAETLQRLGEYISGRADLKHVELRQGLAHELEFIQDNSVDLVVLNSVVQYFPNADYLLEVLKGAVRVTRKGGHVFVGDVRSLALLEAYHASVQLYKAEEGMGIEELRQKVVQAQHREEELVVDVGLFHEMGQRWEKVGRVKVELKAGQYDNELSRFRYDVTLGMGEKERVGEVESWVEWDEEERWRKELEKRLQEHGSKVAVGVKGVGDGRVAGAVKLREYLHSGSVEITVGSLRGVCEASKGEDPDAVMRLAGQLGVELYWQTFGADGLFNVIFNPQWRPTSAAAQIHSSLYRRYTNAPAENDATAQLADLLRDELRRTLPEYMVPPTLVPLLAWPLTPGGKIDLKALPAPERRKEGYRAPRTSTEHALCAIFAETLSLERIGLDDNFFDLGGHSLLVPRIRLKIRERLQRDISTMEFFTHSTIQSLAARLEEIGQQKAAVHGEKLSPLAPVRATGEKLPLFLVHPSGGGVKTYHDLARYLSPAQPVYAFQNHVLGSDESSPYVPIEEMATRYIHELCKVQPHGPYLLGGWSMGGIIAFEMALQLESRGEKVLLVAMLDAAALPDLQQEAMGTEGRFAQELIMLGEAFAAREGKALLLKLADLEDMDEKKQLAFFLRKVQEQELLPTYVDIGAMRALLNTLKNADRAARNYKPRKYSGKIAVLRATEALPNLAGATLEIYNDPAFGWQAFCTLPVTVHFVPGDHMRMAAEPHIRVLAATLQACLDEIQEETGITPKKISSLRMNV